MVFDRQAALSWLEHQLDTLGVTGSSPVAPIYQLFIHPFTYRPLRGRARASCAFQRGWTSDTCPGDLPPAASEATDGLRRRHKRI